MSSEPSAPEWSPGASCPRHAEVTAMVLFGATGDLTRRKLIPAIYSLTADGLLPCGLPIVSVGRRVANREELLDEFRRAAAEGARVRPLRPEVWEAMAESILYVRGELDDPGTYAEVSRVLAEADGQRPRPLNRLFYLAIPPHYFEPVLDNLSLGGLAAENHGREGWPRIVVEKPFGKDLTTARALNAHLAAMFDESQVFRMDHYLGKETVQNILVLRFANSIFEPIWNQNYISGVQITMAETVGLEGRGQYFDKSGMLRDVVQNHVLELLSLVAMEPPASMDADAVRDEKAKAIRAVRRLSREQVAQDTVRAQYSAGSVAGEKVPGYLEEPGVAAASQTETYAALRLYIDNWRWASVPFCIRAGKRLPRRVTEIAIRFKRAPHLVFGGETSRVEPNTLILRIQPDEGINLCFSAKQPGPGLNIRPVPMEFHFADTFKGEPPEAYERLILDALLGDGTLFARADSIESCWELVTPIVEAWADAAVPMGAYEAGSWGPPAADALVAPAEGWREPAATDRRSPCEEVR